MTALHGGFPIRRLTPEGRHFFGGYYDTPLADAAGCRLLVHETKFCDRLPTAEDRATLGWLDLGAERPDFRAFADTRGWNFQQGSFLQWVGAGRRRIVWNNFDPGGPAYAERLDPETGETSRLDRPVANMSPDGQWGLSLSFERLFDFRPGYGYPNRPDPRGEQAFPDDDGIFLIDVKSGTSRLVLALSQLREFMRKDVPEMSGKLIVNHLTFSPSGTRFVALARTAVAAGNKQRWGTFAFTANADGSDVRALLPFGRISHYFWVDDQELLFWCDGPGGMQLYRVPTGNGGRELSAVDPEFFLRDGHMSLSPDGQWLLYDSYPDENREQSLFLYAWNEGRGILVGKFQTMDFVTREIRCDLHPRWNPDSRGFTFDSTHEGYRAVYRCEIAGLFSGS